VGRGGVAIPPRTIPAQPLGDEDKAELGEFGGFARHAFYLLEWLPIRMTAMTFAIVGDFEDTVFCWRTQAQAGRTAKREYCWPAAPSVGVRLGMPIPQGGLPLDRPELGVGDDADADFMPKHRRAGVAFGGVLADFAVIADTG